MSSNKLVRFIASVMSGINIISLAPGYGEINASIAIDDVHF